LPPNEDYRYQEKDVLLLAIAAIVITVIAYYLIRTPTNLPVEVTNGLMHVLLSGMIGLWIKHQFNESAKRQEATRARLDALFQANHKKHQLYLDTFLQLKDGCGDGNRTLQDRFDVDDTTSGWITTHDAFQNLLKQHGKHDYENLLNTWKSLEPDGAAERARQAYFNLRKDLLNNGKPLQEGIKQRAIKELQNWERYFLFRYRRALETQMQSSYCVPEPRSWSIAISN